MTPCDELLGQMAYYLDDELQDAELAAFTQHLEECQDCRAKVDAERRLMEMVWQARPLYSAAQSLRKQIEKVLEEAPPSYAPTPQFRSRIQHFLKTSSPRGHWASFLMPAATAIAVVLAILWYSGGSFNFARMAVDTHQRHLRGQLPLEISSDSPQAVSRWFAGKVPFRVELPNYQESSGQEKLYQIEGARLVGFRNDYAAYVAYQMRRRPISLVVTSASAAVPRGGERIVSQGITFHYDSIDGLKVITWTDRGLTYALVSDLEERGQRSCIVCHQGTKDQDFIENLRPAR
jgi:mycothiol system anti-sigma-R factor